MAKQYWLLKTDAESYSIDDLKRDGSTAWTGVRNYQARNYMRDQMKPGDMALFYHSNAEPPGVAGICEIASTPIPDETAFDPKDSHFDPKATDANPIWCAVEVKYVKHLKKPIPLETLRKTKGLEGMKLLQKGSRLSITPVTEKEWGIVTNG
jgi:predicted RNA-binding protein with PUA-like domain